MRKIFGKRPEQKEEEEANERKLREMQKLHEE
jgi:hypothetical protein